MKRNHRKKVIPDLIFKCMIRKIINIFTDKHLDQRNEIFILFHSTHIKMKLFN